MVLHDVTQGTDPVVELAAVLDAEVLGHGDLDLRDLLTVPHLGERQVAEAQILDLDDRLLAQEVVHPKDLVLFQHRMQPGIEFTRRLEVVSEGLFHRDAGVL